MKFRRFLVVIGSLLVVFPPNDLFAAKEKQDKPPKLSPLEKYLEEARSTASAPR